MNLSPHPQMIAFFKLKQKHANLYEDLYPNNVMHVFEQGLVKLIPTRDQNGARILVIHCGSKYWKRNSWQIEAKLILN